MDQELIIFPSLSLFQKLVPAIQKLLPASQKLLYAEAAPSHPEALSHPDAVGFEGPLAVWKKESYWKTWKKEQDAKQDWKKDWKKRAGNRSGRRRAGRRRAGKRRTGHRKIQKMPRPKSIGEEMFGRSIICQTLAIWTNMESKIAAGCTSSARAQRPTMPIQKMSSGISTQGHCNACFSAVMLLRCMLLGHCLARAGLPSSKLRVWMRALWQMTT